jgi:hypothetical protein
MWASGERIRLLSLVDIFEPLSSEEIERLNAQLRGVYLEPGQMFYSPEDRSKKLFLLWKGRVQVYKTADKRQFTSPYPRPPGMQTKDCRGRRRCRGAGRLYLVWGRSPSPPRNGGSA